MVYMRLIQQRQTPLLLPRLSTLSSYTSGPGVLSVLSPTLRSVIVSTPRSSRAVIPAVWTLMDVLSDTVAFPRLEKFYLDVGNFPPRPLRAPSRMTNLRQLSILGAGLTDLDILADLSTLLYLEDLEIDFSPSAAFVTHPEFPSTAFVALKSLRIKAPALYLHDILEALPVGGLQFLTIRPLEEHLEFEYRRHASWTKYFQIISSKFSASMMTLVVDGMPPDSPSVSFFEPLFEMRKLQKVDLSGMDYVAMSFGDKEFSKFASAVASYPRAGFPGRGDECDYPNIAVLCDGMSRPTSLADLV